MYSVKYNDIIYINAKLSIELSTKFIILSNDGIVISSTEFSDSGAAETKFNAIEAKFVTGDTYFDLDTLLAV